MKDQALQTKLRWLLVLVTAGAYWQVSQYGFINYDDGQFVFANPHVFTGLSLANLRWAFTSLNGDATSYQPLVWLTHQFDCQFFGLQAGVHHVTNLWFHIANTVLLFTLLDEITSRPWRSGVVAALFALHPLHIETVAWISERKSLVCTLFWLLTTLAYLRYVRRGGVANYLLVVVLYVGALLSKPVAVSLPITLLLLDFWPLARWTPPQTLEDQSKASAPELTHRRERLGGILAEKAPLFLLSALACWVTVAAQSDMGAIRSLDEVPMPVRLSNCIVACVLYLRKTFWPVDLAPIYPLYFDWTWRQVGGCALLLLSISIWALRQVRSRPYLLVGWCWYLVTLFPTLGLVQVGSQGMADRYSYVPVVGLFIVLVWEVSERMGAMPYGIFLSRVGAAAMIGACALCTFVIAQSWRSSLSLFEHAIRVTGRNYLAYRQLAMAYQNAGNLREAERLYRLSLSIEPNKAPAHIFLASLLADKGDYPGAFEEYSCALKLNPIDPQAHGKMAELLFRSKDPHFHEPHRALEQARLACRLTHYRKREFVAQLAQICAENGRLREASGAAQKALVLSACPREIHDAMHLLAEVRRIEKESKQRIAERPATTP